MKGIIKNILREHSGMKNDWQQKHFIGAKLIAQRWDDAKFKMKTVNTIGMSTKIVKDSIRRYMIVRQEREMLMR